MTTSTQLTLARRRGSNKGDRNTTNPIRLNLYRNFYQHGIIRGRGVDFPLGVQGKGLAGAKHALNDAPGREATVLVGGLGDKKTRTTPTGDYAYLLVLLKVLYFYT